MKIKSYTLRIFFLSVCLLLMISCKEGTAAQTQTQTQIEKETETTQTQNQTEGIAHFESGLNAIDANNMPLAFKEFLEAAKDGHADSQFNVALMYEQGLGVSKNEKEAFSWYGKSAAQGNSGAQFNLGVLYENGRGTTIDFAKANEWYLKASVQGDGLAVGNLGMLYIRAKGVKENLIAGVALLIMSASMDTSPENQAKNNIAAIRGLTTSMVSEAQSLSDEMSRAKNILEPLDNYLKESKNSGK